jgi:hypothetical protein
MSQAVEKTSRFAISLGFRLSILFGDSKEPRSFNLITFELSRCIRSWMHAHLTFPSSNFQSPTIHLPSLTRAGSLGFEQYTGYGRQDYLFACSIPDFCSRRGLNHAHAARHPADA